MSTCWSSSPAEEIERRSPSLVDEQEALVHADGQVVAELRWEQRRTWSGTSTVGHLSSMVDDEVVLAQPTVIGHLRGLYYDTAAVRCAGEKVLCWGGRGDRTWTLQFNGPLEGVVVAPIEAKERARDFAVTVDGAERARIHVVRSEGRWTLTGAAGLGAERARWFGLCFASIVPMKLARRRHDAQEGSI